MCATGPWMTAIGTVQWIGGGKNKGEVGKDVTNKFYCGINLNNNREEESNLKCFLATCTTTL